MFTNGRLRDLGSLFLDGRFNAVRLNEDDLRLVAYTPFMSN